MEPAGVHSFYLRACPPLRPTTGPRENAWGGVTITLPLRSGYRYQTGSILSPDGHCRAFDARAKGTVPGNGGGAVVLRRLEDALADGDDVYAVVLGSAVNNAVAPTKAVCSITQLSAMKAAMLSLSQR